MQAERQKSTRPIRATGDTPRYVLNKVRAWSRRFNSDEPVRGARSHKVIGRLVLTDGRGPLPSVEVELWDRDLRGHDFLGRGVSGPTGTFEILYDPADAGPLDRPDLELRVIEHGDTARREVHRVKGPDDVTALVHDFGTIELAEAPHPLPADRVPPTRTLSGADAVGMPAHHPLCLPTPYTKEIKARQFLVTVDPAWLAADIPPCLQIVPGLESTAMWGVMKYPTAFSTSDPTGAVYSFEELVIAAFVRERDKPLPGNLGLYFLSIYITTDVAVVVGREMYGFPKKEADVRIGDHSLRVTRPGLAPGEPAGHVHPIELVRATWADAPVRNAAVVSSLQPVRDSLLRLGTGGAALGMNHLFDLPFYNHQRIPAPRTSDGSRPYISRVWKAPLGNVRVLQARELGPARFELGASVTDPIYRLAPGRELVVESTAGIEMEVTFTMDGAELIADYSPGVAAPPPVRLRDAIVQRGYDVLRGITGSRSS